MTETATVALVGAGPGDPGLLTVRGVELLAACNVVVYDHLANPLLLDHCPPTAERVYVGKRAAHHAMSQERTNALLIDRARAGQKVVRLKGGDPFVFGRGGEECEALSAAGISFEVVPGVTAAISVPAYAGIPVTHRDLNSSFTFITGHEREDEYKDPQSLARAPAAGPSDIDWAVIARLPCIAFYMGVKSLSRICSKLIENGMDPAMPAATIQWGTMPAQQTIVGTVSTLPARVAEAKLAPPAITIIGRVVDLRASLNWFESRPLFGKTIVVTRTRDQASELSKLLHQRGAKVIEAPTIEISPPPDFQAVDTALAQAGRYDWIVFTSINGVRAVKQRLFATGHDARALGAARFAAIGQATAAAVNDLLALRVDLTPERSLAESLADEFIARGPVAGAKFLLLRAEIARPVLIDRLRQAGAAEVTDIAVYETRIAQSLPPTLLAALDAGRVDWITFTSGSTARNFSALLDSPRRAKLASINLASIGPVTSDALRQLQLPVTAQAERADLESLVQAIENAVRPPGNFPSPGTPGDCRGEGLLEV